MHKQANLNIRQPPAALKTTFRRRGVNIGLGNSTNEPLQDLKVQNQPHPILTGNNSTRLLPQHPFVPSVGASNAAIFTERLRIQGLTNHGQPIVAPVMTIKPIIPG